MGIWSFFQEVTILIVVYEIITTESDLLESLQPKQENPAELNEFLANVLDHKNDFRLVKHIARQYQKMKKDLRYIDLDDSLDTSLDNYNDFDNSYKLQDKRNIHHHNPSRKFRNQAFLLPNMQQNRVYNRLGRRVKKHINEPEQKKVEKRIPEIIMLREQDDTVQKRMPAMPTQLVEKHSGDKHLPSQIFIDDEDKLQKRTPEEIIVEPEGEKGDLVDKATSSPKQKKQAIDLSNEIHRTYKYNPRHKINEVENRRQGDFYYVDLQDAAEREKQRYGDRRRYGWNPRNYYNRPFGRMYHRPMMRQRPSDHDYYQYDMNPHHSLNDEVAFEKALSYEIEPRQQEPYNGYNNPHGNNLYSVDEGRPDTFEPFYPEGKMQSMSRYDYPPQEPNAVTNERFFINNDNSVTKQETTSESTTGSSTTAQASDDKKTIKHIGNGFVEITKARRDSDEENFESTLAKKSLYNDEEAKNEDKSKVFEERNKDEKESSILAKHSLHPLRIKDTSPEENENSFADIEENSEIEDKSDLMEKRSLPNEEPFQSRKLQFIDDYMTNFYDQNENYEEIPNRPKRDFLDALGMKNEEDYSEDNPYKEELNVNNTDIHNDTHIGSTTCSTTVRKNITFAHQKEDVKNIKKILEEPTEKTTTTTCGTAERIKKDLEVKSSDGLLETNEMRNTRGTNKDLEDKIFKNKDKIYNAYEDEKSRHFNNNNVQLRSQRQERAMSMWPDVQKNNKQEKKSIQLYERYDKKEDSEAVKEAPKENCTETSTTTENSNYEQIAHQMDIENEKLAQVVNGHLASKIVSNVFEELKKKSSLKAKFYSGLSRKHVNYAGTIDFDIFKTNETEGVDEARLLLEQISKVLNKLILNQVRRKLCQRLPDELKDYLDILLNVKNTLQTTNFIPNTHQGDFLFTYQDKNPPPPFDLKKLQEILVDLEGLLLSYHNMNEDCQNRAAPIKDYIEKHVKMLKKIVSCQYNNCNDKLSEAKRDTPQELLHNVLVEKELESLGLGRHHDFVPNFDVNQIVRNKMRSPWKKDTKRNVEDAGSKSRQYKKLQFAVEKLREKRENEKKIGELFGSGAKKSVKEREVDYEEPVVYRLV